MNLLDLPSEVLVDIHKHVDKITKNSFRGSCRITRDLFPVTSWVDYYSGILSRDKVLPDSVIENMTIDNCRSVAEADCKKMITYIGTHCSVSIRVAILYKIIRVDDVKLLDYWWNIYGDEFLTLTILQYAYRCSSIRCLEYVLVRTDHTDVIPILVDALTTKNDDVIQMICSKHKVSVVTDTIIKWDRSDLLTVVALPAQPMIGLTLCDCIRMNSIKCFRWIVKALLNRTDVPWLLDFAFKHERLEFIPDLIRNHPRPHELTYYYGTSIEMFEFLKSIGATWKNNRGLNYIHPRATLDTVKWAIQNGAQSKDFSISGVTNKQVLEYLVEVFQIGEVTKRVRLDLVAKHKNYRLMRILLSRGVRPTLTECFNILDKIEDVCEQPIVTKFIRSMIDCDVIDESDVQHMTWNRLSKCLFGTAEVKPQLIREFLPNVVSDDKSLMFVLCAVPQLTEHVMYLAFPCIKRSSIKTFLQTFRFSFDREDRSSHMYENDVKVPDVCSYTIRGQIHERLLTYK